MADEGVGVDHSQASDTPQDDNLKEGMDEVNAESLTEKDMNLEAELEKVKEQANDYYAHLQRLQAEFDNYRKRTQKEKEDLAKYATERVVKAMLPILDNFERAMAASETKQDFNNFAQGVRMILRQMQDVLTKEGLTPIEAVGQPFDPNLHDAVLRVESDEHPENTVVEEMQKGYYLKDKVLRPSMVKVSN